MGKNFKQKFAKSHKPETRAKTGLTGKNLDPVKFKQTIVEVTEDELLDDYAKLFRVCKIYTEVMPVKRALKVWQKAFLAPFEEDRMPIKENDETEQELFHALLTLRDRIYALIDIQHERYTQREEALKVEEEQAAVMIAEDEVGADDTENS